MSTQNDFESLSDDIAGYLSTREELWSDYEMTIGQLSDRKISPLTESLSGDHKEASARAKAKLKQMQSTLHVLNAELAESERLCTDSKQQKDNCASKVSQRRQELKSKQSSSSSAEHKIDSLRSQIEATIRNEQISIAVAVMSAIGAVVAFIVVALPKI